MRYVRGVRGHERYPRADEAQVTAEVMGNEVDAIYDVGVAGIHRLMHHRERLTQGKVIVCCEGMEGALPSAVGGFSCSNNVAVVNIGGELD